MNKLLIGLADKTEQLLETPAPFLLIDDGPIADTFLERYSRAKEFDPNKHSFNPLKGLDYKHARDFAATLYTASPQGENTLTVRNGKRALTRLLLDTKRLDKLHASTDPGDIEAAATVDDMLLSPVLKSVLCGPPNFTFPTGGKWSAPVIARLDRAELGDFDAFILGALLIGQYKGQVILSDSAFYLRDFHVALIRQERLTVVVNYLTELSPKLQQAVLGIKDKTIYRTTPEDAERLIVYTKHTNPGTLTNQTGNDYELGH